MKRRVAILISGRGSNMAALIEAAKAADFPAEIVAVISNRADAPGLATAAASGIATSVIESKPFGKDRAAFEAALQRLLDEKNVELICLGGFMRLFTAEFVKAWYGKMLNIHPSLLPSFPGLDPHGQALAAGVKISGATVHFVIPETDAGPIVMQGAVAVADDDTPQTAGGAHSRNRASHLSGGAAAARQRQGPARRRSVQDIGDCRRSQHDDLAGDGLRRFPAERIALKSGSAITCGSGTTMARIRRPRRGRTD